MCQFCTALTCLGVRRARSSHLQAESRAILDPVAASQWAARQRFGRAVKVSQGAPRHMAAGEHTVAAAAKNCIAMAPTSWRSIEGGSSARPAAYDFLGVLISTVCTLNSFLKFRAILGKEGSLLILNQFSSYIPGGINFNREGDERVAILSTRAPYWIKGLNFACHKTGVLWQGRVCNVFLKKQNQCFLKLYFSMYILKK